LFNDIVVYGYGKNITIPYPKDKWTEYEVAVADVGTDSLWPTIRTKSYMVQAENGVTPQTADRMLRTDHDGARVSSEHWVTVEVKVKFDYEHIFESLDKVYLDFYPIDKGSIDTLDYFEIRFGSKVGGENKYKWYCDYSPTFGAWNTYDLSKSDFTSGNADFSWKTVTSIHFRASYTNGIPFQAWDITNYYDSFYLQLDCLRSENDDADSGYDSTSADEYGRRTTRMNTKWNTSIGECNAFAANLLSYYKDPEYNLSIKVPYFLDAHVNDNIEGTFYGIDLTLPINSITWNFRKNGDVETLLSLGSKRY
jgi:hypothetical protein